MSEEAIYDVLITLLPDAYKMLKEANHPKLEVLEHISRELPFLVSTATERLKRTGLDAEGQQIQEFFKYSIAALVKSHKEGEWRPFIFSREIFYELIPVKRLFEWVLEASPVPQAPVVAEVNSAAPLLSAKVASRLGGRQILMLERGLYENSLVRETIDEYSRKYAMNTSVVPLGRLEELENLKESLDLLFVGSLDGWKLGWHSIVTMALYLLKRRGILALVLPLNQREGLKSMLSIFDVPVYPDLKVASEDLQRRRFTSILASKVDGFFALLAAKR